MCECNRAPLFEVPVSPSEDDTTSKVYSRLEVLLELVSLIERLNRSQIQTCNLGDRYPPEHLVRITDLYRLLTSPLDVWLWKCY